VTTSTIRFVLIAALVVGGIVLINQAFPEGASAGGGVVPPANGGATTGATGQTGTTGGTAATAGTGATGATANLPTPTRDKAIAVFNTTNVPGLAQDLSDQLTAEGYVEGQAPGNAELSPNSRIYFRGPKDEADAEYIANTYFKKYDVVPAKLEPGSDVDRDVQIAIYIGNDYAADHPSG
jgi:LytR cell envelope-related transcriptional attenuator